MAVNDLASGVDVVGTYTPEQLFAGEADITTGQSVAVSATIAKYQVCVLLATGLSTDFTGVTTGDKCVIAAQPATTGQAVPYYLSGYFNHAALVWPAAQDTLAKRKAFFAGTPIHVGSVL